MQMLSALAEPTGPQDLLARQDLELMIAAVDRLAGLLDSSVIAAKAAQAARELAGVDLVGIGLVEGATSMVMVGTAGGTSEWFTRLRLDVDVGKGFVGTILATRTPLFFDMLDVSEDIVAFDANDGRPAEALLGPPYASHLKRRLSPEHLSEYIGMPIVLNDQVLGLLYAGNRQQKPEARRSRAILARFARMIAPALSAARQARAAAVAQIASERETIAAELHDTIGQILFGIGVAARRSQGAVADDQCRVALDLKFIESEASRAAAHLREVLRTLGTVPPEAAVETEVRILAEMFAARSGVAADVVVSGVRRSLPAVQVSTLTAVVREGLHNVEKHASATTVVVTLHYDVAHVAVVIQDDGVGVAERLDAGASPGDRRGIGLASLRRRVERIGGRLTVRGLDGGGTMLRVVF